MTFRLRVLHYLIDASRWTGLRDRLRCPDCLAVGTWKPHGGWFDHSDVRRERRWLCKWCGCYVGPEGQRRACVDAQRHCWTLYDDLTEGVEPWTPETAIGASAIPNTWPWRG